MSNNAQLSSKNNFRNSNNLKPLNRNVKQQQQKLSKNGQNQFNGEFAWLMGEFNQSNALNGDQQDVDGGDGVD